MNSKLLQARARVERHAIAAPLSDERLIGILRALAVSQELAVTSFAEDGSCLDYLSAAADRLEHYRARAEQAEFAARTNAQTIRDMQERS